MSQPPTEPNPYQSSAAAPRTEGGDSTGGVIPYKNMHALVAYYLAVFSLIPCLGFFTGSIAFVLGIIGLQKRKANPVIKGTAHAWIGIILGGLCALLWGGLMALGFIGGLREVSR